MIDGFSLCFSSGLSRITLLSTGDWWLGDSSGTLTYSQLLEISKAVAWWRDLSLWSLVDVNAFWNATTRCHKSVNRLQGLLSHLVVVFTYSCSRCWAAELVIVCGILNTQIRHLLSRPSPRWGTRTANRMWPFSSPRRLAKDPFSPSVRTVQNVPHMLSSCSKRRRRWTT